MESPMQGLSFPLGAVLPLPPPLPRSRSKLCPSTGLMAEERKGLLCVIMLKTGPQGLLAPRDKEILTHTKRCSVTLFLQ